MSHPAWTRERFAKLTDAEVIENAEELIQALREHGGRLPSEKTANINAAFDFALAAKEPEDHRRGLEMLEKALADKAEGQGGGGS